MKARTLLLSLYAWATVAGLARADDFGPRQDVREVRGNARILLAHRLRSAGIAPESLVVSDVVVVRNDAIFSWDAGSQHGFTGFVRLGARWWDALNTRRRAGNGCWKADSGYPLTGTLANTFGDAADSPPDQELLVSFGFSAELAKATALHNDDVQRIEASHQASRKSGKPFMPCAQSSYFPKLSTDLLPQGGLVSSPFRGNTSGYDVSISYAANDAPASTKFAQIYARRPTDAEILPYPTPFNLTSDAVFYFDLMLEGPKPVTFASGSTVDVWVPWVLDAALHYNLSISSTDPPIGPIYGTLFDNALHFKLPAFTATPGKAVMVEVDGDPH